MPEAQSPSLRAAKTAPGRACAAAEGQLALGTASPSHWEMFLQASVQHSGAKGQRLSVILPSSGELQLSTYNFRYKKQ